MRPDYQIFLYLQLLDFLTTLVGLKAGFEEMSPLIRQLMNFHPAIAVGAAKVVAVGLAYVAVWVHRAHVIRWINYWYAGLVVWNLAVILFGRAIAG